VNVVNDNYKFICESPKIIRVCVSLQNSVHEEIADFSNSRQCAHGKGQIISSSKNAWSGEQSLDRRAINRASSRNF
jgi:hypothetical protein